MNTPNINFQLETERIIRENDAAPKKPTLLLHACCAPCASYVTEYLLNHFLITVFFSNSNITDKSEYLRRLAELYKLKDKMPGGNQIEIVEDAYCPEEFLKAVIGLEKEPEGERRCNVCFELRLSKTADYAAKNRFDYFATTLTVSPHKNAKIINELGFEMQKRFGITYLPSDFKKRDGYKRSIILSSEYGLYRQNYCGCMFSENKSENLQL